VEAICVSPKGNSRLQLARQLTAMSLNCCISGLGSDCSMDPSLGDLYSQCNEACSTGDSSANGCIEAVDCFNNGGQFNETTGTCEPRPDKCHERQLCNLNIGLCFDPPGPAGSSNACNDAGGNKCAVLPTDMDCSLKNVEGEECCASGMIGEGESCVPSPVE
jgi:hypothetical protein